MRQEAKLTGIHRSVEGMVRLAATGAPGVNRRHDRPVVRFVNAYEAPAWEHPAGKAAQQSHAS
jgi:hypothetical protein